MKERLGQQISEAKNSQVGIITELIESKRDLENSVGRDSQSLYKLERRCLLKTSIRRITS
jgi:hypothetical protein